VSIYRENSQCFDDGDFEKGNRDRIHPIAPEFAKQLASVHNPGRVGRVFELPGHRGKLPQADWVSRVVAKIGRKSGVITDQSQAHTKHVSVHDLRRSFGVRWSERLLPQQLQGLMRHESIETTFRYYVGKDADRIARIMWESYRRA